MASDFDMDIDLTILVSEKQTLNHIEWAKVPLDIGLWKGQIG